MGRHPVLILAALGALACEPRASSVASGDAHAQLACAQCHAGGLADRPLPAVAEESCTASGCHETDVPETVTLATVKFRHLDHGSTGSPKAGCAGCHTHSEGSAPLKAGPGTCGLCHERALAGTSGDDCRLCHATPSHVGVTSQGVAIPHEGLPWIEGGCLRCHYEVARPVHEVSLGRCAACHDDVHKVTELGIGEDLHPLHAGTFCGACHEEDNHRIQAMSSAVDLDCGACHAREHGVALAGGSIAAETCNTCHARVHEGPQRVLLGILPDADAALPSQHFMDGVGCASCHIPPDDGEAGVLSGTAQACIQCHRSEYATVLSWWNQGLGDRIRLVDRYLAGAEATVAGRPADDEAVQAVARARKLLTIIREGGGQHNLPLAHRVFEDALAGAAQAYRLARGSAPPAPDLGRTPKQGICVFCHYRLGEPAFSETMDDAFHREVLGAR